MHQLCIVKSFPFYSVLPGAQALLSAWWPGAACPSQNQRPLQHGADPQMTDGCSHILQLFSHTECPFQNQAHLKYSGNKRFSKLVNEQVSKRLTIGVKHLNGVKKIKKKGKRVYLPTTKMILASLILSEIYKKKAYYAFCKDIKMK